MRAWLKNVRDNNRYWSFRDWIRDHGAPFHFYSNNGQRERARGRRIWLSQVDSTIGGFNIGFCFRRFSDRRDEGSGFDIWFYLLWLAFRIVWIRQPRQ